MNNGQQISALSGYESLIIFVLNHSELAPEMVLDAEELEKLSTDTRGEIDSHLLLCGVCQAEVFYRQEVEALKKMLETHKRASRLLITLMNAAATENGFAIELLQGWLTAMG